MSFSCGVCGGGKGTPRLFFFASGRGAAVVARGTAEPPSTKKRILFFHARAPRRKRSKYSPAVARRSGSQGRSLPDASCVVWVWGKEEAAGVSTRVCFFGFGEESRLCSLHPRQQRRDERARGPMRTRHALKHPPARAHWQDEVSSSPAPRAARAGLGAGLGARAWRDLVVVEGRGEQKASLSLAENFVFAFAPPKPV